MQIYQKTISNKLYVLAHKCRVHAYQCTREGIAHKLSFNFHCFSNNLLNLLPFKLLLQQTVGGHYT